MPKGRKIHLKECRDGTERDNLPTLEVVQRATTILKNNWIRDGAD